MLSAALAVARPRLATAVTDNVPVIGATHEV